MLARQGRSERAAFDFPASGRDDRRHIFPRAIGKNNERRAL
jgi:hypothetical protein